MELKGKLFKVGTTVQVSEKFSKRLFVLETSEDMHPQTLEIQLVQDKCNLLDGLNEGDNVVVKINLRGRRWESPQGEERFFNTIEAWAINKVGSSTGSHTPKVEGKKTDVGSDDDGLPF